MKTAHEFEIWQDGICVASAGSNNEADARREIWHYAMQYAQDGPVVVKNPTGSAAVREELRLRGHELPDVVIEAVVDACMQAQFNQLFPN